MAKLDKLKAQTTIPDDIIPAHTPAGRTGRGPSKQIPIETILDLHSKHLSHSQIAKIIGCDKSNITHRLQAEGVVSLQHYKDNRADILALLQRRIVSTITALDIKKASLLQKATVFGILYDKERLERGLSTVNQSIHSLIIERACADKEAKPKKVGNKVK